MRFDNRLDMWRGAMRVMVNPADPSDALAVLAGGKAEPPLLAEELADCPPAVAQLEKVGAAEAELRAATFVGLAEAIAACDCRVNIPRFKAIVYTAYHPD